MKQILGEAENIWPGGGGIWGGKKFGLGRKLPHPPTRLNSDSWKAAELIFINILIGWLDVIVSQTLDVRLFC